MIIFFVVVMIEWFQCRWRCTADAASTRGSGIRINSSHHVNIEVYIENLITSPLGIIASDGVIVLLDLRPNDTVHIGVDAAQTGVSLFGQISDTIVFACISPRFD